MKLEDIRKEAYKDSIYILYDDARSIVGAIKFGEVVLNRFYKDGSNLVVSKVGSLMRVYTKLEIDIYDYNMSDPNKLCETIEEIKSYEKYAM